MIRLPQTRMNYLYSSCHNWMCQVIVWVLYTHSNIIVSCPLWSKLERSRAVYYTSWWRHQMEQFSALLAICAGNSPVPGEFPAQRPVTRNFDVFFDLRLNKSLRKQSWGWWFETPSSPLWRHCNVLVWRYEVRDAESLREDMNTLSSLLAILGEKNSLLTSS